MLDSPNLECLIATPFRNYYMYIGNTKQFGPMPVAETVLKFPALFTAQRKRSLLKRVQDTGHIDFTLSANYQAYGDTHEWARSCLYVTDMKTVNKRNGYSLMIQRWLGNECSISHKQAAEPSADIVFIRFDRTEDRRGSRGGPFDIKGHGPPTGRGVPGDDVPMAPSAELRLTTTFYSSAASQGDPVYVVLLSLRSKGGTCNHATM